jgi:hypothetical protein
MPRLFVLAVMLLAALVQQSFPATAGTSGPAPLLDTRTTPSLSAWNGSFHYSVPIEVPSFRALAPNLALQYDPARGTRRDRSPSAILGIGWSFTGLSVIERISGSPAPTDGLGNVIQDKATGGFGLPVYSESYAANQMPVDNFSLDGTELFRCSEVQTQANSPSCLVDSSDGTVIRYASRIESFVRIRRDTSANTWEVTLPNGVKSIYSDPESKTYDQTFRWYLTTTIDTYGNHIDYVYASVDRSSFNAGPEIRLSRINFVNASPLANSAASVLFYYENRGDGGSYYSDGKNVRFANSRLKTIDVQSAGSRVRAYAITYDSNVAPNSPPHVVSVQQYGEDAAISSGTITGGTSLPPYTFTYRDQQNGFVQSTDASSQFSLYNLSQAQTLDFNGDGRSDILVTTNLPNDPTETKARNGASQVTAIDGSAQGTNSYVVRFPSSNGFSGQVLSGITRLPNHVADFDGDGKDDFLYINDTVSGTDHTLTLDVYLSTGTDLATKTTWATWGPGPDTKFDGGIAHFGDFNGDGRVDLLTYNGHVWLSAVNHTPSGTVVPFFKKVDWTVPTLVNDTTSFETTKDKWNTEIHRVGDFNGDGKTDLVVNYDYQVYSGSGQRQLAPFNPQIYLSTGNGFIAQPVQSGLTSGLSPWISGVNTTDKYSE